MTAITKRIGSVRWALLVAIVALEPVAWPAADAVHAVGADARDPRAIAIRLRVDPSIAGRGMDVLLEQEAARIWQPYGVQLEWVEANQPGATREGVVLEATVERRLESSGAPTLPAPLGRVMVNPLAPAWRPIQVSIDATTSVLANRPGTGSTPGTGLVLDRDLGRALGRVLAHEIGHVLIDVRGHDRAGLMRAVFHGEELAEWSIRPFRLTCRSADHLRTRLHALDAARVTAPCIDA